MKKPADLRAYLTDATPQLRLEPDKLTIFVENGTIVAGAAGSLSYEYRYTLKLIVLDYSGAPDAMIVPLMAWLKINQIDIFDNPANRQRAIRFNAELLNQETVDLSIEVDLSERVIVSMANTSEKPTEQRYEVTYAAEPPRAGVIESAP